MVRYILVALYLFLFIGTSFGQDKSLYQKEWLIQSGDTLPYRILLPENFDSTKKYPVIFFLHGRGESGTDNEKQLTHGATLFLRDSIRQRYPAIVVFPQCSDESYWSNVTMIAYGKSTGKRHFYFVPGGEPSVPMRLLTQLVPNILLRFNADINRVYVAGLSMGGMGTYELVRRLPNTFAAAIAICGGAHPATAGQMNKTAWWIFHGLKDDVVPPEHSIIIANALKLTGAKVQLTLYPEANHNSWDPAFNEPGLMEWLFLNKKSSQGVKR